MRFLPLGFSLLVITAIISSCSYKQDQLLFAKRTPVPDSVLQRTASIRNYRIKSQDILQIRNIENIKSIVDLNPRINAADATQNQLTIQPESYQVDDDGTVALTGLGHVPIAGLTRQEAEKKIEDLYKAKYFKDGSITIELKIINLIVTVLGEARTQGNIPLVKNKTTLVELLGQAGGLTERADQKDIKIIRTQGTSQLVMDVDLGDMKSLSNPVIMQSGDVVYIAENKRTIRAENNQSFLTWSQPVLLVMSTLALIFTLARK